MPVTAKLSRKFYERFGDELTNELNFARFDAKLVSEIERAFGRLETRMATFETRIVRWMFVFWVGTLGTVIPLLKL